MEMLLFLFVVGALIFYLMAAPKAHKISTLDNHRYPAVKIRPCKNACQAVTQASQIVFLSSQSPKLPLNACDRIAECDCQFRHFADRRQQEDRREDEYMMHDVFHHRERRDDKRVGRRVSDRYSIVQ